VTLLKMAQRIRKYIKRTLLAAILLAALVWTTDWLWLRHRIAQDSGAFGEIEVHYHVSVHMKNKRIEQHPDAPQMVECANSLFPHFNDPPCWYLARHPDQVENLDGRGWHFWYDE
jgi:hypothetical protein